MAASNQNKQTEQKKNDGQSTQAQKEPKSEYFGWFRVKQGFHSEGRVLYGRSLPAGDVIHSKSDLVKTGGADKFERLAGPEPATPPAVTQPEATDPENPLAPTGGSLSEAL
jgi:hypothetical protein